MSGIIGTSHSRSNVIGRSQDTASAWIVWDGSQASSADKIQNAFNVSSIDDAGPGNYFINFLTDLPNANYAIGHAYAVAVSYVDCTMNIANQAVGGFRVYHRENGAFVDTSPLSCIVFGD